jgi:hypothetical protein
MDQAPFEQRLLNNLDYLVSLGGIALPLIPIFHAESENPDPARAFAVAFTLGCIEGADAVDVAVAALKQSPPEEYPGYVEGWWLAPSPAIDETLTELLGHPKAALAGVSLDALAARCTLQASAVQWIVARNDRALDRKLARALGTNLPRADAIRLLESLLDGAPEDDEVFCLAVESLIRRGHARGRDLARLAVESSSPARARAGAWLVGISGQAADVDILLEALARAPSEDAVRGLARFGHAAALPPLIELLAVEDEALPTAAAEALDFIAGPVLRETVEEPWDLGVPGEMLAVEGAPPPPMRKVEKVVVDPARWKDWYQRVGAKLDPKKRWRKGVLFHLDQIVDELEAKDTPTKRRGHAARELAVATGVPSSFSPNDWVARQREHLREARDTNRGLAVAPGTWTFAVGKRTESSSALAAVGAAPGPVAAAGLGATMSPSSAPPPRPALGLTAGPVAPPAPSLGATSVPASVFRPHNFTAGSVNVAPSAGTKLGLISYASACAEAAIRPGGFATAWGKFGMSEAAVETEHAAWRAHFAAHPDERAEFDRYLEQFMAHWRTQK